MKRRISIVRNIGKGDVLADKALTIKMDGFKEGVLEAGYRLVFDANNKAHTMTVSYEGEWNLELNHPIPAGEGDIILVLDCEKNNYTISEAEYRKLTIRRENGNTTLGMFVKIDGKHHPIGLGLDNVGDWMTVCVDTAAHTLELQGHGFFGSKDVRKVSVPAGTEDVEYLVSVNDDKTLTVKKKRNPAKKQQKADRPQAEPQKQKPEPKPNQTPPAPKKPADVHGSSTTYHLKMDIKAMFRPDGGELYQWLTSGVENVFMQAMDDAVMFIGTSYANLSSPEAKGKNIFYKDLNQGIDQLRRIAKMTGGTFPKKVHPYNLLESDEEQQTLQQILEEFIKSDQCPGITMINDEICLDPEYGIKIEDSATTSFSKEEILCDVTMNSSVAAEAEASEWNVENAPTTQAVIAELSQQFGAGGGLARFMKDMGFDRGELMTGSSEIVIGFWKGNTCTSRISMQYAQYAAGKDGAYQVLNEEEQKVLQECILAAVPYFNV